MVEFRDETKTINTPPQYHLCNICKNCTHSQFVIDPILRETLFCFKYKRDIDENGVCDDYDEFLEH